MPEPEVVVAPEVASTPATTTADSLLVTSLDVPLTFGVVAGAADGGAGAQSREAWSASFDATGSSMLVIHDSDGDLGLSVRSKNDGVWSEWVAVNSATDESPDGLANEEGSTTSAVALGPIWIGTATEVEVIETSGSAAALSVDLLADTTESLDAPLVGALTNPGQPAIQPRSAWAGADFPWASGNADCGTGPSYSDNIRAAIIHHTVTSNSYSQSDSASMIRGIYYTHVRVNGWCDVAYNFLVDRFGTIWQGRTGDIGRPVNGGHARGFNKATVGIALLGQHQSGASPAAGSPTAAAIGAVEALAAWKLGLSGVDPNGMTWIKNTATSGVMRFGVGQWAHIPTIVGHRDVGLTSCPGSLAYPSVTGMRARLAQNRVGSGPYSFPQWGASDHGPAIMTVEQAGGIRPSFAAAVPTSAPTALAAGRTAVAIGGTNQRGYILLDNGSLQSYGGAPSVGGTPGGAGADDLVVRSDGSSGWILNGSQLIGFGGQRSTTLPAAAVGVALNDAGKGYAVTAAGSVMAVGSAPAASLSGSASGVVDIAVHPNGTSGWVVTANGVIVPFGGARAASVAVSSGKARAIVASPTGLGGWVLDAEGRLHPFGDERVVLPISTTVGYPVAVDAAIVGYVSGADVRNTNDGAYVDALAEAFLGRSATDIELDVWVSQVDYYSPSWLATRLSTSPEYAGAVVDDIYQNALGRTGDAGGRQYWLGQLQTGLPPQALGIYFYGSEEFVLKNGGYSGFVTALYRVLLHREPDSSGHAYWLGLLQRGRIGPDGVAAGFYASIESRRDRVTRLYQGFLGRAPDGSGLDYWADRLQAIGDFALAAELATTDEFYNRATGN
ncbi:MAG: DUF4214 domain-containing protein [Acidimicrobiales bacterium]